MIGLGAAMATSTLTFPQAFAAFASEIPWCAAGPRPLLTDRESPRRRASLGGISDPQEATDGGNQTGLPQRARGKLGLLFLPRRAQ